MVEMTRNASEMRHGKSHDMALNFSSNLKTSPGASGRLPVHNWTVSRPFKFIQYPLLVTEPAAAVVITVTATNLNRSFESARDTLMDTVQIKCTGQPGIAMAAPSFTRRRRRRRQAEPGPNATSD
jgi:hypothetical protein